MGKTLWTNSEGKLLVNASGELFYCDHCPCNYEPDSGVYVYVDVQCGVYNNYVEDTITISISCDGKSNAVTYENEIANGGDMFRAEILLGKATLNATASFTASGSLKNNSSYTETVRFSAPTFYYGRWTKDANGNIKREDPLGYVSLSIFGDDNTIKPGDSGTIPTLTGSANIVISEND